MGLDPGSKREGYTVLTKNNVVVNITTDTKDWVKKHVEIRRMFRRTRRSRKAPYRKCRSNRLRNRKFIPPSTKTRWNTKLLMIKYLMKILPFTNINIEDISAKCLKGKAKWNKLFSPLEIGKNWFYSEVRNLGIKLTLTKGYDTKIARDKRGFIKTKSKLDWIWGAHNVDSHILAELALNKNIIPYKGLWRINFLEYYRRILHRKNPGINGIRSKYGGTVSLSLSRGSILKYKNILYYLGGTLKGMVSIHDINSSKRISQKIKIQEINIMYTNNRRVQYIP